MIAIIDIEMGNITSVQKALKAIGVESQITNDHSVIAAAERVIFPGVGSFAEASHRIDELNLRPLIKEIALENKIPFLGICLGMQLLGDSGTEGGARTKGLELIRAETLPLSRHKLAMKIPHVGWNDVHYEGEHPPMYGKIKNDSCFYFVHSYEMVLGEEIPKAVSAYDVSVLASVQKDNVWGTQFHPEKSQRTGLQLLRNFCEWRGSHA